MATQSVTVKPNTHSAGYRRLRLLALASAWCLILAGQVLAAPTVTTVTPNSGATDVPITSTLVFVFSEPMDTSVDIIPDIPPFLVGNLQLGPSGQVPVVDGSWSDDGRTLTCSFSTDLPPGTTVTWKLNPAGTMFPFIGEGGVPVATLSGNFTTAAGGGGGGGPKPTTIAPLDKAVNVPVSASITFVFDEVMKKNTQLNGQPPAIQGAMLWQGAGLSVSKFSYSWSADGKTLTCDYAGDLPGNTLIKWMINPASVPDKLLLLQSAALVPVATARYFGEFTTGAGGSGECNPNGVPDSWGGYNLSKNFNYTQMSAADPVLAAEDPCTFGVYVHGPQAGPTAVSGSVTLPGGTAKPLDSLLLSFLSFTETTATEAGMNTAYPEGSYTLRFTQTGQPERIIPMTMPAASGVPVPKVANYAAAQSVNAAQAFTLQWNAFMGATASDYISLTITDGPSGFLFQAPDLCVPRELPVTATSIVIPANTLPANKTLSATLGFGRTTYSSTNAVPEMSGFGGLSRTVDFTIKTVTGGTAADPARFTDFRLLPNGNPQMNLTGTAGRTYTIKRTGSLSAPSWSTAGTVVMDGTGKASFEDTQAGKVFPLFYRAVTN